MRIMPMTPGTKLKALFIWGLYIMRVEVCICTGETASAEEEEPPAAAWLRAASCASSFWKEETILLT